MHVFRRAICCVGGVEFLQVHESIDRDLFFHDSDTREQHWLTALGGNIFRSRHDLKKKISGIAYV